MDEFIMSVAGDVIDSLDIKDDDPVMKESLENSKGDWKNHLHVFVRDHVLMETVGLFI